VRIANRTAFIFGIDRPERDIRPILVERVTVGDRVWSGIGRRGLLSCLVVARVVIVRIRCIVGGRGRSQRAYSWCAWCDRRICAEIVRSRGGQWVVQQIDCASSDITLATLVERYDVSRCVRVDCPRPVPYSLELTGLELASRRAVTCYVFSGLVVSNTCAVLKRQVTSGRRGCVVQAGRSNSDISSLGINCGQ